MLSSQDNETLCRISAGTPMGQLVRQYWIPALMSGELAGPDAAPLRVRLLGEDLIAFRATSGAVGLIQNACPHRGASMFFGRNEEEGLRCVYHGWKFDVTGACVDMPSEPAESNFRNKVRTKAYPCVERNGIIWTYMGPEAALPSLPDIESNLIEAEPGIEYPIRKVVRQCNWVQALEGDIDTSHFGFLHRNLKAQPQAGSFMYYMEHDRAPRYNIVETEIGTTYGAYRPAEEDCVLLAYCPLSVSVLHDDPHRHPGPAGPGAGVDPDRRRELHVLDDVAAGHLGRAGGQRSARGPSRWRGQHGLRLPAGHDRLVGQVPAQGERV